MDLASNPYAMQFNQNLGFENWQRYAGNTNKETGKFEFGPQKKVGVVPPINITPAIPSQSTVDATAINPTPFAQMGIKPATSFGTQSSQLGLSQPKSISDAVNLHLED